MSKPLLIFGASGHGEVVGDAARLGGWEVLGFADDEPAKANRTVGGLPVALSGRVYCWADASYGPIQPGDLLTTSDTPGHAMKVSAYERAQGAIIGKAMSSLDEGQGLILVLVTLQ